MILRINNKAGLAAISKGYGRDEAVNNMLAFMWCFLARTGTHLHCGWVHSAHNLADCKSRRDLSEARAGGCCLLHLPWKPLRSILQRCALDVDLAASTAVALALDWSSKMVLADLALDGMSELEMVGYGNSLWGMLPSWNSCELAPFSLMKKKVCPMKLTALCSASTTDRCVKCRLMFCIF